jgi:anti-sigma-K factor RskA
MRREDHDRLAAEHVMGLLEGAEAALAEQLLEQDAGFAQLVSAWRARFAELDETCPPAPLDASLWGRIEASVGSSSAKLKPVAPLRRGRFLALWENLGFWRVTGLASAAAATMLAVGLGFAMQAAARKPVLVAVLLTSANQPAGVVNAFADGHAELLPLQAVDVPEGRVLEIWTLWDAARGPVSLGTLDAARSVGLRLDKLPRTTPNQLFEITLEPAGGSTTGRPTGPVLMKGTTSTAL